MTGSNRYRAPHACPTCGTGPLSGSLYCRPCGQQRLEVYRYQVEAQRLAPGPNIFYHCGQAHPVTQLPLRLACCGMVLALPEEDT